MKGTILACVSLALVGGACGSSRDERCTVTSRRCNGSVVELCLYVPALRSNDWHAVLECADLDETTCDESERGGLQYADCVYSD